MHFYFTRNRRLRRTKKRGSRRAPNLISPLKTSGLRSAQPKKKPPMRATISLKILSWCDFTKPLEPILARSAEAPPPVPAKLERAPPEKPFAFLRFPPAEFLFLVEKGVSGGGVSPFERLGGIFSCIYSVSTRKNDIIEKSNSVKRASFQKLFYAKSFWS